MRATHHHRAPRRARATVAGCMLEESAPHAAAHARRRGGDAARLRVYSREEPAA